MNTLTEKLLAPTTRPAVIEDCLRLIDEEVADKGGLSGVAIKLTYKVVKAVKPTIMRESVDALLDDFVKRMEPFYERYQAGGAGGFEKFVSQQAAPMADGLLGITDDRAGRSKNDTLKGAYKKLRPEGKKHVEAAMPRIGRLLVRHGA